MKISIIISTYNRPQLVLRTVNELVGLPEYDANEFEIIIVSQGLKLNPTAMPREVKILHVDELGASLARNAGVKHASGEYLWFLDDDATVSSLDKVKITGEDDLYFVRWKERPLPVAEFLLRSKLLKIVGLLQFSGTPMYVMKRNIFLAAGGFNEEIGPGKEILGGEDADLLLRARKIAVFNEFIVIGEFSHPIEKAGSNKLLDYAYCRGIILRNNNELFLIFLNTIIFMLRSVLQGNKIIVSYLRGVLLIDK